MTSVKGNEPSKIDEARRAHAEATKQRGAAVPAQSALRAEMKGLDALSIASVVATEGLDAAAQALVLGRGSASPGDMARAELSSRGAEVRFAHLCSRLLASPNGEPGAKLDVRDGVSPQISALAGAPLTASTLTGIATAAALGPALGRGFGALPKAASHDAKLVAKFAGIAEGALMTSVDADAGLARDRLIKTLPAGVQDAVFKNLQRADRRGGSIVCAPPSEVVVCGEWVSTNGSDTPVSGIGGDEGGESAGDQGANEPATEPANVEKLESFARSVFDGVDPSTLDISAALEILMLEIARDNEHELRDFMKEVKANLEQKRAWADTQRAIKARRAEAEKLMRSEFEQLQPYLGENVTFDDYAKWRRVSYPDVGVGSDGTPTFGEVKLCDPSPMPPGALPPFLRKKKEAPATDATDTEQRTDAVGRFGLSPELNRSLKELWRALPPELQLESYDAWLEEKVGLYDASSIDQVNKNAQRVADYLNDRLPGQAQAVRDAAKEAANALAAYIKSELEAMVRDIDSGYYTAASLKTEAPRKLRELQQVLDASYLTPEARDATQRALDKMLEDAAAKASEKGLPPPDELKAAKQAFSEALQRHDVDPSKQAGKLLHGATGAKYAPVPSPAEVNALVVGVGAAMNGTGGPSIGPSAMGDLLAQNMRAMLDGGTPALTAEQRSAFRDLLLGYDHGDDAAAEKLLSGVQSLITSADYLGPKAPYAAVVDALINGPGAGGSGGSATSSRFMGAAKRVVNEHLDDAADSTRAEADKMADGARDAKSEVDAKAGEVAHEVSTFGDDPVPEEETNTNAPNEPAAKQDRPSEAGAKRTDAAPAPRVAAAEPGEQTFVVGMLVIDVGQLSMIDVSNAHISAPTAAPPDPDEVRDRLAAALTGAGARIDVGAWEQSLIGAGVIKDPVAQAKQRSQEIATTLAEEKLQREAAAKGFTGTQRSPAGMRQGGLGDLDRLAEEVQGKVDSLGDISQMNSMRLQMFMDRRSKIYETLSNVMKKIADTSSGIIRNIIS